MEGDRITSIAVGEVCVCWGRKDYLSNFEEEVILGVDSIERELAAALVNSSGKEVRDKARDKARRNLNITKVVVLGIHRPRQHVFQNHLCDSKGEKVNENTSAEIKRIRHAEAKPEENPPKKKAEGGNLQETAPTPDEVKADASTQTPSGLVGDEKAMGEKELEVELAFEDKDWDDDGAAEEYPFNKLRWRSKTLPLSEVDRYLE